MAKQREVKQWITINGKHVPIFEGESKEDAVKRAIGKNDSTGTEKKSAEKKEEKPDWIADWDPIPDDPKEERKKRLAREKADEDDAYDKEHGEGKYSTLNTKTKSKKSSTKSSKDNDIHYDTKLNDIRERMRSGKITPDQAKDEAFEYEKSQRTNKKWNDVDRNRMESKMRDIFDEADKEPVKKSSIQKQISKDLDTKEKQIKQHQEEADKLNGKKESSMSSVSIERKLAEGMKKYNRPNADKEAYNLLQAYKKGQVEPERLTMWGVSKDELRSLSEAARNEAVSDIKAGRTRKTVKDPMGNFRKVDRKTEYEKNFGEDLNHKKIRTTSVADLRKQALAAGYSKEKIQGMTKAQLKKLLG